MKLESFKQLTVWQRSIELVKEIYRVTGQFPKSELYGLISQMRRAVISISSNIAEGYKRKNLGEYVQFLSIADASCAELETQLIISKDLYNEIDFSRALSLLEEVQKMLISLIRKLNPKPSTLNPKNGFTIVELLVAITLFSVIVAIATGTFVQSLRTQRGVTALIAANSNVSLAMEQMAREIRTGQGFSLSGGELNFTNARGQAVAYRLRNESIEKAVNGETGVITAANVRVSKLNFLLAGESPADGFPTKIVIMLEIGALEAAGAKINLQTVISSRILEG